MKPRDIKESEDLIVFCTMKPSAVYSIQFDKSPDVRCFVEGRLEY